MVEAAQEADAEGGEAKREAAAFLAKGQALQWMHTKTYLMWYDKGLVVLPRWCWRMRQGERRIHTKSYLVCKDLGCAEHMHKCWMPQACSRLGEIRVGKVSWREPR